MVKNRIGVWSKDRTCEVCRETFDTPRGLLLHQKNKIRVGCYRAGRKKQIMKINSEREKHFKICKKRVLPKVIRVAAIRPTGQPLSAAEKQIHLNVFDYFLNQKKLPRHQVSKKSHSI